MRDPERILEKIRQVWEKHPDLRLAQLLVNAMGSVPPAPHIFYHEDNKLEETLDQWLKKQNQE